MAKIKYYFSGLLAVVVSFSADDCWAKPVPIPAQKNTTSKDTAIPAMDIEAVVGERAITSFDVDARVKMIVATTKISDAPEVLKNIRPQVIRTLVDELLQLQLAEKNGIKIEQQEINMAIATIEKQRGMATGSILSMLAAARVPEKTFIDQIRSQLAWNKWLGKNIIPSIKVTNEELNLAKAKITAQPSVNEVEIAVINLPVDKNKREPEIKKTADNLAAELNKGARFDEVARQFSAGAEVKSFWIPLEQLEPSVVEVLKTKKSGEITSPIRTSEGFSIIKLLDVRAVKNEALGTEVSLKEILLKLKPDAPSRETDAMLQIAEEVSKHAGTCEEKGVAGINNLDDFNIEVNFHSSLLSEIPVAVRSIIDTLKIGGVSTPFASDEGIRIYMLCGKRDTLDSAENTAKIRESILRQKFELEAQKTLRNLRRDTFVETRGGE